jgi:hypothetical protein
VGTRPLPGVAFRTMSHRLLVLPVAALLFVLPLLGRPLVAQQQERPNDVQVGVPVGREGQAGQRQGGAGRPGGPGRRGGGPVRPTPRAQNGHVLIGSTPTEKGLWLPGGVVGNPLGLTNVPMQPWARALAADRRTHHLEPHARCKPSGVVRPFLTPYGVEFVELADQQLIYIFDVGGPHTWRTVYMDGRSHPSNYIPDYYGHSIGWWEGDTLVVETTGFNEGFWLDRGQLPHTETLRTLERFTRTNFDTLKYELTVDDPAAYTAPFSGSLNLVWEANTELLEYVCQEANYAHELMVGRGTSVDRSTLIVP